MAIGSHWADVWQEVWDLVWAGSGGGAGADIYWLGTTDTDPSKTANWAGGVLPGTTDNVIFNGAGNNPCTLVANTTWGSLTAAATYTSTLTISGKILTILGDISWDTVPTLDFDGGILQATGGSTQWWNLGDGDTKVYQGDIRINKTAATTLSFATGLDIQVGDYRQLAGTVDFDAGQFEATGDWIMSPGCDVVSGTNAMNGVALIVAGVFSAAGQPGDLLNLRGTAAWTIDVTGLGNADHADISYCNAGAGSEIRATLSTDSGNNTNCRFITEDSGTVGAAGPQTEFAIDIGIGF